MKASAVLAVALGLAVALSLILANNAGQIAVALAGAGWGVVLVIALHLPQTAASALGWRPLILDARPGVSTLFRLRFVREAVNALLPVAQVGGDVVRARLLAQTGVPLAASAASCTADLTLELASQAAFTLLGVAALFAGPRSHAAEGLAVGAAAAALVVAAGFLAAQRLGLAERLSGLLVRLGERARWPALGGLQGLGQALQRIYADPRRLAASGAAHLTSWLLGVLETGAGLWALGLHPSWREALVVESLGQVVRTLGFAIPGALGVQEGGYVLICSLFGVAPSQALALSLIRRVREIALGAPGLMLWQWSELRRGRLRRSGLSAAVSAALPSQEAL